MGRSKKVIKREVVPNKTAKIVKDTEGQDRILVVEEKTFYVFKNLRPGPMFFKRSNGNEDKFDGYEVKEDIDEKEKIMLMNTLDYKNGWIVEETDTEEVTINDNKNAISDSKMKIFIESNKGSIQIIEDLIKDMTSEFSVNRIKNIIVECNMPSSLVIFCDHKLKELEEAYLESNKAPVDRLPEE